MNHNTLGPGSSGGAWLHEYPNSSYVVGMNVAYKEPNIAVSPYFDSSNRALIDEGTNPICRTTRRERPVD